MRKYNTKTVRRTLYITTVLFVIYLIHRYHHRQSIYIYSNINIYIIIITHRSSVIILLLLLLLHTDRVAYLHTEDRARTIHTRTIFKREISWP